MPIATKDASPVAARLVIAVQGASNQRIQGLLADFVERWSSRGVKIAGAFEVFRDADSPDGASAVLRDIGTGGLYPIYQDLGPCSTACRLDARGVVDVCESVRQQILAGRDLVVLSKFGKLEAGRSGLIAAFAAAVETGTPIVTAVSPSFAPAWQAYAGPLFAFAPPDSAWLDAWWRTLSHAGKEGRHPRERRRETVDARPF